MATELIEPLERELMRRRTTTRNDGFSPDGLSYSVANDSGKLWGQAMADYDARVAAPRTSPFGGVMEEDRPASLRQELFDPLLERFAQAPATTSRRIEKTPSPRTYKFGSQLISVDPRTGETTQIYDAPDKPDTRGDSFERQLILGRIGDLRRTKNDPAALGLSGVSPAEIDSQIAALEDEGRRLFEPKMPPAIAAPVANAPTPMIGGQPVAPIQSGFMHLGDMLEAPRQQASPRRPTRALAREYKQKYGDRAAEQLRAEGFDLSSYAD